jgi:Tfp pilus assembly major pilin PilA
MRRRQQGMTLIGLLCVLGLVGVIVYAGIRLAPLYLNYMKVARSMSAAAEESKGENPDPGAIRHLLERHWQIESIDGVDSKDVEITKGEDGVEMHVAYDDSSPYIANVSLMVHFDKTVKVQ